MLILLAETHSEQGLPAMALPHVLECMAVCERQRLSQRQAVLRLAHIEVGWFPFSVFPSSIPRSASFAAATGLTEALFITSKGPSASVPSLWSVICYHLNAGALYNCHNYHSDSTSAHYMRTP